MRYALGRILHALPLAIGVATLVFFLLELAPGDTVDAIIGDFPVSNEYREQIRVKYGLDGPLWERYTAYIGSLLQGDLGYSHANQQDVTTLIGSRIGNTLILTVAGLTIAAVVGVVVGVWAGVTRRRWIDNVVTGASVGMFSVPAFWAGQILLLVFAMQLGLLPVSGMTSAREQFTGWDHVSDIARHLALPAVAIALRDIGATSRIVRASVKDVLGANHIWTARAKGLVRGRIITRHVVRNALLPGVTVIGYSFGTVIAGSTLVETVFGWPGMGRLLYDSIIRRDNAVVIGISLVIAITVLLVNIITDLVYGWLDPRIRYGAESRAAA